MPAPAAQAAQVLVVDDEPDLRTLYELTLLREGYRVEAAGSLAEAVAQLASRKFDAVITDMRLPDGHGIELRKRMTSEQRSERCIVMTAYGSAENAVEALKAGAFDYLTKPVDLKQFRTVVASAIQEATRAARRHAVPRRDRRPAAAHAVEAAARDPGAPRALARLDAGRFGRRAHRQRDAPRPRRGRAGGPFPPGPVLPPERHRDHGAAAARAPRRPARAVRRAARPHRAGVGHAHADVVRSGDAGADVASVQRHRARAREPPAPRG